MDPVSLEKLLSVTDAIEESRERDLLSISKFHSIVAEQTQAKDPARRARDLLRVFNELGWVRREKDLLYLTEAYSRFISAWNEGNLLEMNQSFIAYAPYSRFLQCLRDLGSIQIPDARDKEVVKTLGKEYGLTFVAFDTFRFWAVAIGQGYLAPFEGALYWGGEWNNEEPSLENFTRALHEGYREAEKTSGYANIGRVADLVCRRLHISFQAFELKMNRLVKARPGLFVLAPATIRPPSSRFQIATVCPRSEVLKKRWHARLLHSQFKPRWIEHRYIEDGILIDGHRLKLIKWEVSL